MSVKIGVKTNKKTDCPFISYFGFFDPEMGERGASEPYRHIDGDEIEYKPTVYGYLVTLKNMYDIVNGKYLSESDLSELKLMYAEIEDDHEDDELTIDRVWIESEEIKDGPEWDGWKDDIIASYNLL